MNKKFKNISLQVDSPVPLYFQIEKIIREKIYSGELKKGEKIPTELELEKIFCVSRTTLRRAISNLVRSGLIEIRRGDGSYVSSKSFGYTTSQIRSFSDEAVKQGFHPRTIIIDFKVIKPFKELLEFLEIGSEEKIIYIKRQRLLNNEPVGVDRIFIPLKFAPQLSRGNFKEEGEEQSLYNVLKTKFGINLKHGKEIIVAILVSNEDAALLDIKQSASFIYGINI